MVADVVFFFLKKKGPSASGGKREDDSSALSYPFVLQFCLLPTLAQPTFCFCAVEKSTHVAKKKKDSRVSGVGPSPL